MKSLEYQCLDFWRSKPADEEYNARDPNGCALGQFASSLGGVGSTIGWLDTDRVWHEYPTALLIGAYRNRSDDFSFGAAATRLAALLGEDAL